MGKFKKGDTVYYISDKGFLSYDKPYEVLEWHDGKDMMGPSIKITDDQNRESNYGAQAFISEEEYNSKKKPTETKKEFKPGDMAYYDGPDLKNGVKYDTGYILWIDKNPDVFNLYLGSNDYRQVTRDFVNKNFITQAEYKQKKKNMPPESTVGSYDSFVKRFKSGSTVYYVGDKIPKMKKDTPYKIDFYNPLTKLLKIGDDTFPDDDFVSEEQYEKLKMLNIDNAKIGVAKEGEKTDVGLKMQIFKETRSNTLVWIRPFPKNDEWYRSFVHLNQPKESYLRIDMKRPADLWELEISYYRKANPISKIGGDSPIIIRKMKESSTLLSLIKLIEAQIESKVKDLDNLHDLLSSGKYDNIVK